MYNYTKGAKFRGRNVAKKAIDTYTDMQNEIYNNKGNLSLKDYGIKKGSNMLFGNPLNMKKI